MEVNDVVYQRVAGIDVSKRDAKVCIRVPSTRPGQYSSKVATWGATVPQIMELKRFLEEARLELVVMESTSDYWKPFSTCWKTPSGAAGQCPSGPKPARVQD